MKKRYTSQDIADMLGISRGTVYRALNNKGRINEDTRKKVLDAAKQLGYKPNRLARALVMQKETRIAAILPEIPEYFFSEIEKGIKEAEKGLRDYGVSVKCYHTGAANDALAQIEVLESLANESYDGIVLVPANSTLLRPHVDTAVAAGMPVVVINNDVPHSKRLCYVGENSTRAGKMAAELMGKFLGSEGSIAILEGFSHAAHLQARVEGFMEVLKKDYPEISLIGSFGYAEDTDKAYRIAERLIKDYPDLRGIFLTTTTGLVPAAQAVYDCRKQGVVKVIGFDNSDEIEDMMQKNVIYASIYQDQHAQGFYALRILSRYLSEGEMPERERMHSRLGVLLKAMPNMAGYSLYKY